MAARTGVPCCSGRLIVRPTFSFPLVLMLAVLLFLFIQSEVDRRDPKLRAAPRTVAETVIPFEEEDEL